MANLLHGICTGGKKVLSNLKDLDAGVAPVNVIVAGLVKLVVTSLLKIMYLGCFLGAKFEWYSIFVCFC